MSFSGSNTDSGSTGGPQAASGVPIFFKQQSIGGVGTKLGSELSASAAATASDPAKSSSAAASNYTPLIVGGIVAAAVVVGAIIVRKKG